MATIKGINFSHDRISNLSVSNGDTVENCNLMQLANTPVCEGITGLTFINCNLVNCSVPGDAVIENCLTIQKSFCSHLHPDWSLTPCIENCSHVIDTDEIWIDNVLVDTIYHHKDTLL